MSEAIDTLLIQSVQARRENRLTDARRSLVAAVDFARKADDRAELARALTGLGQIERDLQHGDVALQHYAEAAAIRRDTGDELTLAHTVRHLGDIYQDEGAMSLAETCYQEALGIYRGHERTQPLNLANALRGLAILKGGTGDVSHAKLLWEEARDLYASVHVQEGVTECVRRLALLNRRHRPAPLL